MGLRRRWERPLPASDRASSTRRRRSFSRHALPAAGRHPGCGGTTPDASSRPRWPVAETSPQRRHRPGWDGTRSMALPAPTCGLWAACLGLGRGRSGPCRRRGLCAIEPLVASRGDGGLAPGGLDGARPAFGAERHRAPAGPPPRRRAPCLSPRPGGDHRNVGGDLAHGRTGPRLRPAPGARLGRRGRSAGAQLGPAVSPPPSGARSGIGPGVPPR